MENNNNQPKEDFTGGDHSFKNWFKIMWGKKLIALFIVALAFFVYIGFSYDSFGSVLEFLFMLCIPFGTMLIIIFKGFIQEWNDMKHGRSR